MNLYIMRQLQALAALQATTFSQSNTALERDLDRLAREEERLRRKIQLARTAQTRVETYLPRVGDSYVCPSCTVYLNLTVSLYESRPTKGQRVFTCGNCGIDYELDVVPCQPLSSSGA